MRTETLPNGGRLTYLERADWDNSGAPRLGHVVDPARFRSITVHHTVSVWADQPGDLDDERRAMRTLRTIRTDLGLDVPYSFVLFRQTDNRSVVVAEGRGWERTGAHTRGRNSTVYGVALAGDYRTDPMTDGLVAGVRWVGQRIVGAPNPTTGHRDHKATICPGPHAYDRLAELQPPFTPKGLTMAERAAFEARISELEAIITLTKDPGVIVDAAYRNVFNRRADKVGRAFWLGYLNDGGSVADMLDLFRMSAEAKT